MSGIAAAARGSRAGRRAIDGVVLLDKPPGITSHAAVRAVRRLFEANKAGHTGTLDPLATGLLPVCLGEATKFSHFLLEADKTYLASIRLGLTTTTGDLEGEVVERMPVTVARPQSEADQKVIAERLSKVVGKTVVPHFYVNPGILGGKCCFRPSRTEMVGPRVYP